MLNTFPTLLSLGLLAPFFIRVTIGLIFFFIGINSLSNKRQDYINKFKMQHYPFPEICVWIIGIIEIFIGIFLTIGLYTQITSLIAAYISLNILIIERENKILPHSSIFYILLSITSLSLLFSGAGFLAFDLPL